MDDKVKQKEGESRLAYIKRITENRLEYDIDYNEWSQLICGKEYSSENSRKAYYIIKPMLEALDEEIINKIENDVSTGDDLIQEIELKKIELEKERKKIQATKIEYNKMIREQAQEELIIESLRDIISTIQPPEFEPLKLNKKRKEWVLSFGDIHYDKFFESVNNKYSVEELTRRFNLLLAELIEEIDDKNINHLTITNLGDSLEGLLRISAYKTMRIGLLESVVQFSRFMAEWLNELSKYVEITYYHVSTANHCELRMFNQQRGETDENLERVIVNYIHDLLKDNPRIYVPIITDKNFITFKILDYNFIALHGDGIKNIKGSLKDLSVLHRTFYDYVLMGHFHSGLETTVAEGNTNNMEVLVVPSIVGSDNYSDSLFVGSKSSAKLYGFTQDKGHTETRTFILN
jgi:hypothetical protein